MTPMTTARIALALMAADLFALGVRTDYSQLRWATYAFLTLAVLLRFFDRSRRPR